MNQDILFRFKAKLLAVEKYNATHGNAYSDNKNYILRTQAIKILEECLKEDRGAK